MEELLFSGLMLEPVRLGILIWCNVGLFVTDWVQDCCCDVYLLLGYKLLLDLGGRPLSA